MKKKYLFALLIVLINFSFAQTKAVVKPKKVVYKKAENGLAYKFFDRDEKLNKPIVGDKLRVILNYSNSKDSVLFNSQNPSVNNGKGYVDFELGPPTFKGCFEDALMMMSVGDSASFQINADSVFIKTFKLNQLPPYVESGSLLTFNVKMLEILSAENLDLIKNLNEEINSLSIEVSKLKEQIAIDNYIRENKITVKPNDKGVYFIQTLKGKKATKPEKGDTVVVNYVGRMLSGKVFDTNIMDIAKKDSIYSEQGSYKPIDLPFNSGNTIPGWDEGVGMMTVGSKAKFIIPSKMAYGENGLGNAIPPYTPIVFEVELVNIKPQKK